MGSTLEWALALRDKFTGVAGKAAAAAGNLEGKLATLGGALAKLESGFSAVKDSIVGDMFKKAGELTVAGAQLAIDSSSFKEDSIVALKNFVGSQAAAAALFDKADDLAGRLGIADEAVVAQLRKLMASGFSGDTALGAIQAAADLAAARGEESAAAFTNLLSTIEAKGKFDTGAISKLAKAGVRTEDIYNQLAKTLHKSRTEVEAMVKAGKIDAATGIEAATAAIHEKFGGAGEEAANTFSKLLFRLKDALGDLFQDVDLGPLKDSLKAILDAVNGPAGAELKAGISHFFGEIFKTIGKVFEGPEGAQRLKDTLHSAARAFELAAKVLEVAGPVIAWAVGLIIDALNVANSGRDTLGEWATAIGDAVSAVAEFFLLPVRAIMFLIEQLAGLGGSFLDAASSIGTGIIDGLVAGILGGASAVVSAITGVAKSAIDAAASALQIHSPSAVFAELGHFTAEGFGQGLAANDNPQVAAEGMLDTPTVQAAAAAGAGAGRSAGAAQGDGGGKVIQIHIHGGDDAKVRRTVYEAIEAMGWS